MSVSRVLKVAGSSARRRGHQAAVPWTFPSTVPSRRGASSPVVAFSLFHSSGVWHFAVQLSGMASQQRTDHTKIRLRGSDENGIDVLRDWTGLE